MSPPKEIKLQQFSCLLRRKSAVWLPEGKLKSKLCLKKKKNLAPSVGIVEEKSIFFLWDIYFPKCVLFQYLNWKGLWIVITIHI